MPEVPRLNTCGVCAGPTVVDSRKRRYCPACKKNRFIRAKQMRAENRCSAGHEMTPGNSAINIGRGRATKRCITCRRKQQSRKREEYRTITAQVRKAKAIRDAWFDRVVVQRVISGGVAKPGRPLTKAEWFAVFEVIGDLSANDLSDRAGCDTRTVSRYRAVWKRANDRAA